MNTPMKERWLASFGPDKEIYTLAEKNGVFEYITRDKPNGDPFGRAPTYHVWDEDQWLYCGPDAIKANETFLDAMSKKKVQP